jgi:hypothetical protein
MNDFLFAVWWHIDLEGKIAREKVFNELSEYRFNDEGKKGGYLYDPKYHKYHWWGEGRFLDGILDFAPNV